MSEWVSVIAQIRKSGAGQVSAASSIGRASIISTLLVAFGLCTIAKKICGVDIDVKATNSDTYLKPSQRQYVTDTFIENFLKNGALDKWIGYLSLYTTELDNSWDANLKTLLMKCAEVDGILFWNRHFSKFVVPHVSNVLEELCPDFKPTEREDILFEMLTPPKDIYPLVILDDIRTCENVVEKHPFLNIFDKDMEGYNPPEIPKIKHMNLSRFSLNKEQKGEIERWAEVLSRLQWFVEQKNYYISKIEQTIRRRGLGPSLEIIKEMNTHVFPTVIDETFDTAQKPAAAIGTAKA